MFRRNATAGPRVPWGPRTVAYGLTSLIALQIVVGLVVAALMSGLAVESEESVRGARIALSATLLYDVGLVGLVIGWTRLTPRALFAVVGVVPVRQATIWLPAATAAVCYVFVIGVAFAMRALGLDALAPSNTVPAAYTADIATTVLAGFVVCLAAPVGEEVFYRGFLVGGLARFGPVLALSGPGILFAAVHLDLGSMIPYTIIGVVLGWLYWRRGRLIDAIVFHVLFNATSFAILVSQS